MSFSSCVELNKIPKPYAAIQDLCHSKTHFALPSPLALEKLQSIFYFVNHLNFSTKSQRKYLSQEEDVYCQQNAGL